MIVDPIVGVFLSIILTIITIFFGSLTSLHSYSFSYQKECISNLAEFVNGGKYYLGNYIIKESLTPINDCCVLVYDPVIKRVKYYCLNQFKK